MLKNGWIREIHDWHINPGHYSKLKCVKKASGKFRYTLACVEINKYTAKRHFRTDDLRTLKDILEPGMHMGLLDIQDAFYSKAMRLHHQHTRYFRFAIKTQVGIRAFEYTVTPQGWSSSPRAMHIMLREVKKAAHRLGILHARATDDIIICHQQERTCGRQLLQMERLLEENGFKSNKAKKKLPSYKQIWFGAKIESTPYVRFTATKDKIKEMKRTAAWIMKKDDRQQCTPRMMAGFIGKIRSAALYLECAMAHTVNLVQAQTQALAATGQEWDRPHPLTEAARREVIFFLTRCKYPGRYMATNLIEILLVTDASNSGYGGKILKIPQDWQTKTQQVAMGFWTDDELNWHINVKEMLGSFLVAKMCLTPAKDYVQRLQPTVYHLNVLTDNQVARSYTTKQGGRTTQLSDISKAFHEWAKTIFYPSEMVVTSTYLEGDRMIEIGGDELSRMGRIGEEVQLNPRIFRTLCRIQKFRPRIDLFASRYNNQTQIFFSAHHDLKAAATNAMIQEWRGETYAFPPINMIPRFLYKLRQQTTAAILTILPLTPAATWYPQLLRMVASDPVLIVQGRKTFISPNDYTAPRKQWSKWAWIGVILSHPTSQLTEDWRRTTRKKWLRGYGHRQRFQAIRANGRNFEIGSSESMVLNRLRNLSLSSALRNG